MNTEKKLILLLNLSTIPFIIVLAEYFFNKDYPLPFLSHELKALFLILSCSMVAFFAIKLRKHKETIFINKLIECGYKQVNDQKELIFEKNKIKHKMIIKPSNKLYLGDFRYELKEIEELNHS